MLTKPKKTRTRSPLAQAAEETDSLKQSLLDDTLEVAESAIISQEDSLNDSTRQADQALDVQEVTELTDDELQKELKRFLIPKLRSASYRWSERSKAIKNARVSRGLYECAICKIHMKNGEFKADHINPVVALEGWESGDWTTYINRMFVAASGFQIICTPCHDVKSDTEVQLRKMHRERKKANKKVDK